VAHDFDQEYWRQHWQRAHEGPRATHGRPPHPYLARETSELSAGTALDAGCGEGAEAIWLASRGWHVTAVDIAAGALARAAEHEAEDAMAEPVHWVEADLTVWRPETRFDLVVSSYAHPTMSQLEFYDRIATWVAPGGTLLIVAHHRTESAGHGRHHPPGEASVTAADITARLDDVGWEVLTAEECVRTVAGREAALHDVVVRARRR
jgi:2-polyprenyl-3-methyl-5-hydroxy-6-metoxy-1,4-benzoquinol methylase